METTTQTLGEYIEQLANQGQVSALPDAEQWPDMIKRISVPSQRAEVDKDTFWYFLEVLPPKWMSGGVFCFAEGLEPFRLFWAVYGKHYCRQLTWPETRQFCEMAHIDCDL